LPVKLYRDLKKEIKALGFKAKDEAEKEIKAGKTSKERFVFDPKSVD